MSVIVNILNDLVFQAEYAWLSISDSYNLIDIKN